MFSKYTHLMAVIKIGGMSLCRKPIAKEYLKLTKLWDATKQEIISENVRRILEEKVPECRNSFNAIWNELMKITNSNKHTVYAWMNRSRNNVKVPLTKLCMIADALDIDIMKFFKE